VLSTTEPAQLDDAAIVTVLAAADTAEIAPSQLAVEQAQEAQVRQYAEMMLRDHGMLSDSLRALTQAEGITPDPGRESEQLETQTRATLEGLRSLSGAAFDSAYVAAMVQSHEAALNAIDSQLLPAASNPALRTAIEQKVRPTVAAHLEQAEQVQSTLNGQ
jgi:putative membrane protein